MSVVIIPTYLFFSKKWERKRKKSDSNMFLFVFGKGKYYGIPQLRDIDNLQKMVPSTGVTCIKKG